MKTPTDGHQPDTLTVNTPAVSSRSEAWAAWEASMLSKYRSRSRPKNNFWMRFKKIKGDLYAFDEIKQYSGEVTYTAEDGQVKSFNLLEGKSRDWYPDRMIGLGVMFKPEYPELIRARWIVKHVSECGYNEYFDPMFRILRIAKDPELADLKVITVKPGGVLPADQIWMFTGYPAVLSVLPVSRLSVFRKHILWCNGLLADSVASLFAVLDLQKENPNLNVASTIKE